MELAVTGLLNGHQMSIGLNAKTIGFGYIFAMPLNEIFVIHAYQGVLVFKKPKPPRITVIEIHM